MRARYTDSFKEASFANRRRCCILAGFPFGLPKQLTPGREVSPMRRFAILSVLVGLGIASLLPADWPVKKPPPPSAEQFILQLADRDYHVRDKASRALASLGVEALPALQKGRQSAADPEVRRRLDELIPSLERAAILMPRLVSLHMTNKAIRDVLNELTRQTGYKFADWPENPAAGPRDKLVDTFHFDKLPFWEAFDKISEASGLTLQQQGYWPDDALHVYQQDAYVPFACYNGPFKVIATGFNYNRSNNFGQVPRNPAQAGQQTQEYLQVNLQIATEPRLPILKVGQVRLTVAEDDEKHSMVPNGDANGNFALGQRFYSGG